MEKQPIKLLCVDDEPFLLEIMKEFLERYREFSVTMASSAKEALNKQDQPYDCVISDYQMPGMDGISYLEAVRATGDDRPFIIFTGKGREDVAIQALNSGADFYVQKGGEVKAQFSELTNMVRHAVGSWRAKEALRASNRMYAVLSQVSHAIINATSEIDLYNEVCEIAVTHGEMPLAAVAQVGDEDIVVVASKARTDVQQLVGMKVDRTSGPLALVAEKGGLLVLDSQEVDMPGLVMAREKMSLADAKLISFAYLPLKRRGSVVAVLALCNDKPLFFRDESEMGLMRSLSSEISYALDFMEKEKTRDEEWARFKAVLAAMDEGVYIVDREHDIIYVNPVVEAEFGHPLERKCYDYFHDRSEPCPWCKNDDVFAGRTVTWEWTSPKSGRRYLLRDQPLPQPNGNVLKIEFFREITQETDRGGAKRA